MDATLTIDDAVNRPWDILVIGAGPAGAMAACEAAAAGARVLLVDRARFPRTKVCGCCLNGAALGVLERAGLGALPEQLRAPKLREFQLAYHGRIASVPLREGISLSRERFDTALIEVCVDRGAQFLDAAQALVQDVESEARRVELRVDNRVFVVTARIVIVASGLGARSFDRQQDDPRLTARTSRIGAGAVLSDSSAAIPLGRICMACHRDGYVGLVRLEDGRLNIAAALDSAAVKRDQIAHVVGRIIDESGLPVPEDVAVADWHGTAKLTQRRDHVFGDRYFVVGDAAGYIEPFTGEGMAWALATGKTVASFALESLADGTHATGPAWVAKRSQLTARRMRLCRTIGHALRHPTFVGLAVWLLARSPGLAKPIVHSLNASFRY